MPTRITEMNDGVNKLPTRAPPHMKGQWVIVLCGITECLLPDHDHHAISRESGHTDALAAKAADAMASKGVPQNSPAQKTAVPNPVSLCPFLVIAAIP